VVINNRAYFANLSWTGKIYQRSPILRYRGSGEVVILSPSGTESLAGLAYTAYSGLIGAIISATAQSGNSIIGVDPGLFADAQLAIENALVGLEPRLTGTGPSNGYNESEKRKVRVKGMRRFF
jgi:VIT1/CCC1 family predicted Fe2+/Mn2+ transporter